MDIKKSNKKVEWYDSDEKIRYKIKIIKKFIK